MKEKAEQPNGNYQGSCFRMGKSIINQMFVSRQVFQKRWAIEKDLHVVFIDFKKTFGSIYKESMINIVREF